MKHWILIASLIMSGLFIAWATYKAGLKQFAFAIAGLGTLGWVLVGIDQWLLGGTALVMTLALVVISRGQMKKHHVGLWAPGT